MRWIRWAAVLIVAAAVQPAVEAEVPDRVAERLDRIITPSDTGQFEGSYVMTVATVVQMPGGLRREEVVFETEVEQTANGRTNTRLLRYVENGIDVTEDQRAVIENIAGPDTSKDGHRSDLTRPSGDTADRYLFGEPELFGSEVVVDFEPAPGHEEDPDLAEGRLAWDPDTLDPVWMELTAVHPPPPLKELSVRFEFAKLEELTVVVRKVTDGLAKIQMMQREFHTDLRFDDLRPAE